LSPALLEIIAKYENIVFVGDFNAHHPVWGGDPANTSGINLINFLESNDCVMLNTNIPTHFT